MKDSEVSKASEASKSSQASYASTASPRILYYLKSASVAAKSAPRRPGDLFGDPPSNFGEPRKPPDFILLKISFWARVRGKRFRQMISELFAEIICPEPTRAQKLMGK